MEGAGSAAYFQCFGKLIADEKRLNEEVIHPLFGYKVTYRRCLELQARLLGKALTGEIDKYPPLLIK